MGKCNDISSNPDKKRVNPVSKIARLNGKLANSVVTIYLMEDDVHSDLCFTSSTDETLELNRNNLRLLAEEIIIIAHKDDYLTEEDIELIESLEESANKCCSCSFVRCQ